MMNSRMAWLPTLFNFDKKYVATDSPEAEDCLAKFSRENGFSETVVRNIVQHPPKPQDVTDLDWAQPESNPAKRIAALERLEADYISVHGTRDSIDLGEPLRRALRYYHPNSINKPYACLHPADQVTEPEQATKVTQGAEGTTSGHVATAEAHVAVGSKHELSSPGTSSEGTEDPEQLPGQHWHHNEHWHHHCDHKHARKLTPDDSSESAWDPEQLPQLGPWCRQRQARQPTPESGK